MGNVQRLLIPGAVLQSVMIGGGYGTGREVVEFFTRFGALPGLAGLVLAAAGAFAARDPALWSLPSPWSLLGAPRPLITEVSSRRCWARSG